MISPYAVHRHPALWRTEQFDPERFTPEHSAARLLCLLPLWRGHACALASTCHDGSPVDPLDRAQRYQLRLIPGHPVEPRGGDLRPALVCR